ncbi:helix-turn-helix domain-containing protein [Aneurinibacillus migulanus]|uniref:helix-turn-helix domain-containing protein n=1 Tax=Aneurinibacillus migulanus TaxID=47500 RepID=UPI00209F4C1A|nr:helix-turn-helix transcriptional regulator [Aneurinibacillus migulanus]MCP1355422.1 helix-turn-helix transcriptional regulator [Aneurinibacillus migulanus]
MLAQRLRQIRKSKKLTQEELANRVSTTKGTISNYENGHSSPPNEMLVLLAETLGTTTDYLLGRTTNPSPKDSEDDSNINVAFYDGLKDLDDLDPDERQFILDMVEDTVARFKKRKAELKAKKNK